MVNKHRFYSFMRFALALTILLGALHRSAGPAQAAAQFNIVGPAGSVQFGTSVTVLPNGNIVITDPNYDGGLGVDVGAVYLYHGATGAQISILTGMTAGDQIGSGGVSVLSNGNYVVRSPSWNNDIAANAGAVTWGSGVSGVSGVVSAANSLVGSTGNDRVGHSNLLALGNGNYVVRSHEWNNAGITDAGAVTWGNGAIGTSGVISAANSLVGSTENDQVGNGGVKALENGNYVVISYDWDNAAIVNAGAVTWGNGAAGTSGVVSAANSLVGSTANDYVGNVGVQALSNGNYVVMSNKWDNAGIADAGAVTWGNGATGTSGVVSAANSLVGSTASDRVGSGGVQALDNGNYVVGSHNWDNAGIVDAGAITWGNGATGTSGVVSASNSLVGSTASDRVGSGGVQALDNGNYVVGSHNWDNAGIPDAGAVTWGDGATGASGVVSTANSLVGSMAYDKVGFDSVLALNNGNYVVRSYYWDNAGIVDAGAITWGNGATGTTGALSAANSLVGSTASDRVGSGGVKALNNGNYVVMSDDWDNAGSADVGAVTWGNGAAGTSGVVSPANSLVGSTANDYVGNVGVQALSNGNYVVMSNKWDNAGIADAGAVTWGNGATGTSGVVSAANSLVGSTMYDLSSVRVQALNNGNYVAVSYFWDNAGIADAGAVTWGNGATGTSGVISAANSLVGSTVVDRVGNGLVEALDNGNYVVSSPYWGIGDIKKIGAVTWGDGTTGITGTLSAANSLVGSNEYDQVGKVTALSDGGYVVESPYWNDGEILDVGAITWSFGAGMITGAVNENFSVMGATANGGPYLCYAYDPFYRQLVVGRPYDNIVTILKPTNIFLPLLVK